MRGAYRTLSAGIGGSISTAPGARAEPLPNECKSNTRLLEYGACGFPVVLQRDVRYRTIAGTGEDPFRDWVGDPAPTRDLSFAQPVGISYANGRWRIDSRTANLTRLVSCLDSGPSGRGVS